MDMDMDTGKAGNIMKNTKKEQKDDRKSIT